MDINLKIYTPIGIALNLPVQQVDFEAIDGFYTFLPKHTDMISALKPGILSYKQNNQKHYVACNKGVIVKKSENVFVSTPIAILSDNLSELEDKIKVDFKTMTEERKEANLSMAKLELGLAKGILSLKEGGPSGIG